MSCQQIQREILDRLAAGEVSLPGRLTAHQEACAECASYYRAQAQVFQSIDDGLSAVANAPMPPSLLPGVRARLDEPQAPRVFPFHRWTLAAFAAIALAAVAFTFLWHRPTRLSNTVPEVAHVTAPRTVEPKLDAPVIGETAKQVEAMRHPRERFSESKLPVVEPQEEPAPEVIVLAEEREAFARFIAQVPRNPETALALTRPLPKVDGSAVEIALLMIKPVEVKPLEGSEE